MKRVIVAVFLLCVVTAMSIGALWELRSVTTSLLEDCDALIALQQRGDLDACREAAEHLNATLEERARWFPFFLRHERIEEVFRHAAALPDLIRDDDEADFLTEVSSMRMQLEILLDSEVPSLANIF